MHFLLNDTVLDLDLQGLVSIEVVAHLRTLPTLKVVRMITDEFARTPNLVAAQPNMARKAAAMLVIKQPEINAALFAPGPDNKGGISFGSRFASLDPGILLELKGYQDQGRLTPGIVNAYVWTPAMEAATAVAAE